MVLAVAFKVIILSELVGVLFFGDCTEKVTEKLFSLLLFNF